MSEVRFLGLVNIRGAITSLAHTMGLAHFLVAPVSRIREAEEAPPSDRPPPTLINPGPPPRANYVPATLYGTPDAFGMTARDLDLSPRRLRPL